MQQTVFLLSNQNQQPIHRAVSIQKPSVSTACGVPWCVSVVSGGVQESLGRKEFLGGLKHHGTLGGLRLK